MNSMLRRAAMVALGLAAVPQLAAAQTSPSIAAPDGSSLPPALPPAPIHIVNGPIIPQGARIDAALDNAIGTAATRPGQIFSATVRSPFYDERGNAVLPAGSQLVGRVTESSPSSSPNGRARLSIVIDGINRRGTLIPVGARVVQAEAQTFRTPDDLEQARLPAGAPIAVQLTTPVPIPSLRWTTTQHAWGGGPR
jgi:hypothetical protein